MAALRFPKFASSDVAAREWETRAGKKKPVTEIKVNEKQIGNHLFSFNRFIPRSPSLRQESSNERLTAEFAGSEVFAQEMQEMMIL